MQKIYSTTIAGVSVLVISASGAGETDKTVPLYAEPTTTTTPSATTENTEKLTPQIHSTPLTAEDDKELRKREAERLQQQYRSVIKDEPSR